MSTMHTYVVGEPMPYPAPAHVAPDSPTIRTNANFMDIHLYSAQPQQDRVMWQKDEGQLGLFLQDNVPTILVHFPKYRVTFDCPFNIRLVAETIRTAWFASDQDMAGLILASYPTNHFYSMQRIGVAWAAELRQISQITMSTYPSTEAIERQQRGIEVRFSTGQMRQRRWTK